ncbi:hypothetical protein D3C85_1885830 [compost metagenome]
MRVFDRSCERVDLLVTGISAEQLTSSRAISNLIVGLRNDLEDQRNQRSQRRRDSL